MSGIYVRGKQVSPPAPFRKVASGGCLEETTHTAGMNPAYLVALGTYGSEGVAWIVGMVSPSGQSGPSKAAR
jgi:hypothetical protein